MLDDVERATRLVESSDEHPPPAAGLQDDEADRVGHDIVQLAGDARALLRYQIQPQIPAQSIDTEVFALDRTTKQVVPTDSFSCQGIIPSYGINCTGVYGGNYEIVSGQFSIDAKLCAEPRVDPLLTVVYATRTATGVSQAIAGPFDLGRPQGCPKSAGNGKWRIPPEKEESPL